MSEDTQEQVVETERPLNYDPKEVEAELVKQAQARADDPGESASQAYYMYVPHFKRLLPSLSTRGLRRVLNFLVLYPFSDDGIKSATEAEKSFMVLINSLIEAKFIMVMDSYNKNAETLHAAQSSTLTEEEKESIVSELRAGGVSEEEIERLKEQNKE